MESASKKHNKTDSTMEGWIKLNRKLLDWEWHDDPAMFTLWIHLLLLANFEDKKWHGIEIKRGQLVTGLANLHELTGLSVWQVRACLARLRDCEQITSKTTNKFSVITITNYDSYQDESTDKPQADPQTNHKQTTTTKEYKNIIINNSHTLTHAHAHTHEGLVVEILEQASLLEQFCMHNRISVQEFVDTANEVVTEWELTDVTHRDRSDAKRHLFSIVGLKLKDKKYNNNGNNRSTYEEQRNKLYAGTAATIARLAAEDDARAAKVRNS